MKKLPTTQDGLLNRRVALEQPAEGYRVAVDTVLLAAAVPAVAGDRILDLGCGVGGAMLCVACRVAGVSGTGIEIQSDLVEICRRNIAQNNFAAGLGVLQGNATNLPPEYHDAFDDVFINPPYHEETRHDASANLIKQTANTEKNGDLALWIHAASTALKISGRLTLIHRADRHDEILSHLQNDFSDVEIVPLLPQQNGEAKRIIIRAQKGAGYVVRHCAPLVLHKSEGSYTEEAEALLRHCTVMTFSPLP